MSRKRRVFDIEMPGSEGRSESEVSVGPRTRSLGEPGSRRGPMASAIAENAGALAARAKAEAAIRAENDALAHELVSLRRAGLVAELIPLDAVVTEALVRDRAPGLDPDLAELITSIRETGLSNPIRVEEREDGRFELIQGMRRLAAFRRLWQETGDEQWSAIPAGVLPRGEGIAALYRRMVDENVVRRDLSFAEMAEVARRFARDPATDVRDAGEAVGVLFASSSYQKRSYIRSFTRLLDLLEGHLNHPQDIPRSLGLAVLKQIEAAPDRLATLYRDLAKQRPLDAREELAILREAAEAEGQGGVSVETPAPGRQAAEAKRGGRRPRTTFGVTHGGAQMRCVAGVGHLELRADMDFTAVDRRRLEAAIARMLDDLTRSS